MLSDAELKELAGAAAFSRGRGYYADGRVRLLKSGKAQFEAEAEGSETYRLWLKRDGKGWRWDCSCPAADDGGFCKHLVAAVLLWRDGNPEPQTEQDDLLDYLRMQPAERLALWLKQLADEDTDVERRLRLFQAESNPALLKKTLGSVLGVRGFLDYQRSLDYAHRLGPVIAQLETSLASSPAAGRELIEYALRRLLKTYANADDSAGAIGEILADLAKLHARACALAPGDGRDLAKQLYQLQTSDEWGLFPAADYWKALGETGQAEYARLIAAELARLPPKPDPDGRHDSDAFYIRRRAVDYARVARDFELLLRVLQWDLSNGHAFIELVEACREFKREREALQWAERGVKKFPNEARLRDALAGCLADSGLKEEALEQHWAAFVAEPDEKHWDALKKAVGKNWPMRRTEALEALAGRPDGYSAGQRVRLLMHDGDLDGALAEARARRMDPDTLMRLAQRIESRNAKAAGELYLRVARSLAEHLDYKQYPLFTRYMQRVARLLPEREWREWFDGFLVQHRRKTRLMELLKGKGLI